MAKKAIYFNEAERHFVAEQCTIEEIASKLKLSEKTVRNWKAEGDWETKRLQCIKSKQAFHAEMYELTRALASSIKDDINARIEISPSRLNALSRLIPLFTPLKKYEDALANMQTGEMDVDALKDIIKVIASEEIG